MKLFSLKQIESTIDKISAINKLKNGSILIKTYTKKSST